MKQERQAIYRLILAQAMGLALVTLLVSVLFSFIAAKSVLLGGLCCLLPTIYFARVFFRHTGARQARLTVTMFYLGEVIKLVFMGCLCIVVFKLFTIQPVAFCMGFLFVQFMFWLAPFFYRTRRQSIIGGVV